MSKDELLKDRYKVIAPYPEIERHNIKVGDIITRSESAMCADKTQDGNPVVAIDHEIFPAIFRKLEWYEERDVNDMPEYVKVINKECSFIYGIICKVDFWGIFEDTGNNFGNEGHLYASLTTLEDTKTHDKNEEVRMHVANIKPATEQEYLAYINTVN